MNFNENDLWRDKKNSRLSKLPSAKVLLKLEFDTEDQVLFPLINAELSSLTAHPQSLLILLIVLLNLVL